VIHDQLDPRHCPHADPNTLICIAVGRYSLGPMTAHGGGSRARTSDQDRRRSVTNADLRRGARSATMRAWMSASDAVDLCARDSVAVDPVQRSGVVAQNIRSWAI